MLRLGRETILVEISDRDDLRAWLEGQPREVCIALAARAALRAVPFLRIAGVVPKSGRVLPVFRAVAVASAAAKYPLEGAELYAVASAAASSAATAATDAITTAAADAAATAAATAAYAAYATATAAGDAAATASSYDAASAVLWKAVGDDIAIFETTKSAKALACLRLWRKQSAEIDEHWRMLKANLLARRSEHWEVWTDWYDDRLKGRAGRKRLELARVRIGGEVWDQGAAVVNAHIAALIEQFAKKKTEEPLTDGNRPSGPSVPPLRAAAIEPEVREGRIVLPSAPAQTSSDAESIAAALTTLGAELDDLARGAEESNLDIRFIRRLRDIAKRCNVEAPTQFELFRLGHDFSVLSNYSRVVDTEWPDYLSTQYYALRLHFERCVRKFPKWLEFLDQPKEMPSTPAEIEQVSRIAKDVADAARDPDGRELIDPAIPAALDELASQNGVDPSVSEAEGRSTQVEQELAADVLESVNNILKRGVELFLAAKGAAGRAVSSVGGTIKKGAGAYIKGLRGSYEEEMEQAGKGTIPAIKRWVPRLMVGTIGVTSATSLIEHFPATFKWLEPIVQHLLK